MDSLNQENNDRFQDEHLPTTFSKIEVPSPFAPSIIDTLVNKFLSYLYGVREKKRKEIYKRLDDNINLLKEITIQYSGYFYKADSYEDYQRKSKQFTSQIKQVESDIKQDLRLLRIGFLPNKIINNTSVLLPISFFIIVLFLITDDFDIWLRPLGQFIAQFAKNYYIEIIKAIIFVLFKNMFKFRF